MPVEHKNALSAWVAILVIVIAQIASVAFMIGGVKQQVSDLSSDVQQIKGALMGTQQHNNSPASATVRKE